MEGKRVRSLSQRKHRAVKSTGKVLTLGKSKDIFPLNYAKERKKV